MASSHLLDTSVYSQPLKPKPLASVESRWRALGDKFLAISIICQAEVLYGLELKQSPRLRSSYAHLLKGRLPVLPVDEAVAQTFSILKAACRTRGFCSSDFDLLIAATAKTHGLILATLNTRHFQGIEGIAFEDWSKEII